MIFIICYPGGDLSKICVAQCFDYEKSDYVLASKEFWNCDEECWVVSREDAIAHAKYLAEKFGKTYVPFDSDDRHTNYTLDEED